MDLDMTESLAPKSDQLDAVDLVAGPRTFMIEGVSRHNAEQPFNFHLAGFPRVWRPGKSMRRVIAAAWGVDASKYAGQSVTLYCDPTVTFGPDTVGGTRISHMTGLDKPLKVPLLVKRGKSSTFTVKPLTAPAPQPVRDWAAEAVALGGNIAALRELWNAARTAGADQATLAHIQAQAQPTAAPAPEPVVTEWVDPAPGEHDPTMDSSWNVPA